ncbi:hypothetical protein JAO29_21410 [Edaphobacter sp. HDX4]|uniref:hypothetical protein n=1 Tax=Edaphobacter sp. HDX4 TaxID=2794064 RepID=UPI002FE5FA4E
MSKSKSSKNNSSATEAARIARAEAQFATVGNRLKTLSATEPLLHAYGEDPKAYSAELTKQYAALASRPRPSAPVVKDISPRVALTLDRLADIFGPWQTVAVPTADVGLVEKPNSSKTSGDAGGVLSPGYIIPYAAISNSGSQEQWWVNTWQYVIPLPITPTGPGRLAYRFYVQAGLEFYRQNFLSGSAHVYATVAITNDLAGHPIDFSQPASSTFAIAEDLPTSEVPPLLSGYTAVNGHIDLVAGKTPAIGILCGLILSVAQGELRVTPDYYSYIFLTNPDARSNADIGKIEYRIDPIFWVEAVAAKLTE